MNDFINIIKELPFIKTIEDVYSKASDLYLPNEKTKEYLALAKVGNVVDIGYYLKVLSTKSTDEYLLNRLNCFFSELGARNDILFNQVIYCGKCSKRTCNFKQNKQPNKLYIQNCVNYRNALCKVAKHYDPQRDNLDYEDAIKLLNTFGVGHDNSTTGKGYLEKWYIEKLLTYLKCYLRFQRIRMFRCHIVFGARWLITIIVLIIIIVNISIIEMTFRV